MKRREVGKRHTKIRKKKGDRGPYIKQGSKGIKECNT
jgi:hypothetical protein